VGHRLGAGEPHLARRSAHLGYALGAGLMGFMGLLFITCGTFLARLFSDDPEVVRQAGTCLFITGFVQLPFASGIVFGSALRGAGDTKAVMLLNLSSILLIRCLGVLIVGHLFHNLTIVWIVLCSELSVRGTLMYLRFRWGPWTQTQV
jgi:Na+-driven multidrug efflux pump